MGQNKKSLYIHIPFCKSKCHYCSFVSYLDKNHYFNDYINTLSIELKNKLNLGELLTTIYIGGGTPSLLPIELYELLFITINELAKIDDNAEVTMEVNPGTVNDEYLCSLRKLGINRLSIGVQSFDDKLLMLANRPHNSADAVTIVNSARKAGFDNISIDLIYGLPTQDEISWSNTLITAVGLDVEHISTYGLKIESGTFFAGHPSSIFPDEDKCAELYLQTIDFLTKNGYKHYEISNFAKNRPDTLEHFESRHNINYWQNNEYIGVGVAAHGYIDEVRYANTTNFGDYLSNPNKQAYEHTVTSKEKIEEAIFLGLRMTVGLNLNEFKNKYDVDIAEKYRSVIDKYTVSGHLEMDSAGLRLTREGILLSNTVLSEFLE